MSIFKQLALALGISDRQLRRYATLGAIVGAYRTKGGHWRLRGKLTKARIERAQGVLSLNPTIAKARKAARWQRANKVILDVQKQWKETFKAPRLRKKKSGTGSRRPGSKIPKESLQESLPIQPDLF